MREQNLFFRNVKNAVFKTAVIVFSVAAVLPLVIILGFIAYKGLAAVNPDFFIPVKDS